MNNVNTAHAWFPAARYGLFIHWGPYAAYGRGEQVLFREQIPQAEYSEAALAWNPSGFDAREWARLAVAGGFKYAVLTTRHHDGYCLWNTARHEYSSWHGAPRRDFVREYADAFREAGLKVGLYYSLADWRVPAYFAGPQTDAAAFESFITDVHAQVEELLSNYGTIDVVWFDGAWPHSASLWQSHELIAKMRALQPHVLINNRLGFEGHGSNEEAAGGLKSLGDFGTPEHHITAETGRMWESCNTSTSRLWGYTVGEHWRTAPQLLDMLCEAGGKGGNLLLNVGPDAEGCFPEEFIERSRAIGDWLKLHGEAIYNTQGADVFESVTRGYQTQRDDVLYLILRFWDGRETLRFNGLENKVLRATLLAAQQQLQTEQHGDVVLLHGLPRDKPSPMHPVIKLELDGAPRSSPRGRKRLWGEDAAFFAAWARGE